MITPLYRKMIEHGYSSTHEFARKVGVSQSTIARWEEGFIPQTDEVVYRVAGLLEAAPTDLWPDWEPSPNGRQRKPYTNHGVAAGMKDPEPDPFIPPQIYVGRRFWRRSEGGRAIPATVVELGKYFFRVRFDAPFGAYHECFRYQALRDCELKEYDADHKARR